MNVTNLKKQNKLHSIKDSPFYLLRGKGQFEKLLFIKWDFVDTLLAKTNTYRVFKTHTGREIQNPLGEMKRIHKRIAGLLARIQMPDYLTSKKQSSYIDNAKMHIGALKTVKTDISKFFPSTTFQMVYQMFLDVFQCAKDIAAKLAKICCFKQEHVPTGSHLSGSIAFFSAKKMFDQIEQIAITHNCILSVYVDDITISGDKANGELLWEVRRTIKNYGYSTGRKKSKNLRCIMKVRQKL